MQTASQYTIEFLTAISSRLSGREDCTKVEYLIVIDQSKNVEMDPTIYVYPSRYRRKESDKLTILQHIQNELEYSTNREFLVPGKYKYKRSVSGKQRRWTLDDDM